MRTMKLVTYAEFSAAEKVEGAVLIFTDGACSGNPGPGGWGALLRQGALETELYGGELSTTNNRMELTGAIEALRALPEEIAAVLTTDSQYLKNGIESWITTWMRNGWKTSAGQPVKNQDLWMILQKLCTDRKVTWTWVKGHSGAPENERVDALAKQALARTIIAGRR